MADAITIKALQDASLDAKSLEEVVNGNDAKQVTTRLGESYPSVKKAFKTLFENGGLPATPFKTKALMESSELSDSAYALVTDDAESVDNGLYIKEGELWVKSKYDPFVEIDAIRSELLSSVEQDAYEGVLHVFTDSDSKIVGSIDKSGKFDITLSEQARDKNSKVKEDLDSNNAFHIIDPNDKVIATLPVGFSPSFYEKKHILEDSNNRQAIVFVDRNNKVLKTLPNEEMPIENEPNPWGDNYLTSYPITSEDTSVYVQYFEEITPKMQLNTIAKGRTGSADIEVNGDGITHPKMIYVPQGWNGYKYWLAATPTFGVIPDNQYENPHVWASNDLENWVEPSGGAIDLPEDGNNSYWSDTHLALGDDGYLYCWYRGSAFTFSAGRAVYYKRSRDGVNWSERVLAYRGDKEKFGIDSGNMIASPAIHKDGNTWACYDVAISSATGLEITGRPNESAWVFRRNGNSADSSFGRYDTQQIVDYTPVAWGVDNDPWHIDSVKIGNMYLHLIAVGYDGQSKSHSCYLAWSKDGWTFNVLPNKLTTGAGSDYRSSLTVTAVERGAIELKVVIAKTTGVLKLYNLKLGVK